MTRQQPLGTGHRLILIREQDGQHSGSGCCGRLGEAHTDLGGAADFSHSRAIMEALGVVYRSLRRDAPGLTIDVVDPRNTLWLYPAVWRASRSAGRGLGATLKNLTQVSAVAAVVLDGDLLYSGALPAPETVIEAVMARLHASTVA